MLLLDENDIKRTGIDWHKTTAVINEAVKSLATGDYAQPVKPYLRYRNPKNRIIAMPAFVGGEINMSGIKWIASFPGNINKGLPRAHSVVVLNDADTGEPVGIISTALLSIVRTASVSGLVIKKFDEARKLKNIKVGITGFGPIGQHHLDMCLSVLENKIDEIIVYDIRPIEKQWLDKYAGKIRIAGSWEEAYTGADLFITCTVSDAPYITLPPKPGSLHLNVSLRDYHVDACDWFKSALFVDDWEEVCREKTDIEMMHLKKGLQQEQTQSIIDIVMHNRLEAYSAATPVMFNPMGMAVFDIAMGNYYYQSEKNKITNSWRKTYSTI